MLFFFLRTDTLSSDLFFRRNLIETARLTMLVFGDGLLFPLRVVDQSLPPNNYRKQKKKKLNKLIHKTYISFMY